MRHRIRYQAARRAALRGGLGLCVLALGPVVLAAEPASGAAPKLAPTPVARDRRAIIIRVLDEAMLSMNMKAALALHGSSLSAADKTALLQITAAELTQLKSARAKLKVSLK